MAGRDMRPDLGFPFASLIGHEQEITFQTLELLKKLEEQTQEKKRRQEKAIASFIDIDDDSDTLLGNNKRKGRKRPREDDDDDDCVIIDGNTKQGNGAVNVERLNKEKAARTALVIDIDDDDCVIVDGNTKQGNGALGVATRLVKATKKGVAVLDQYLPDNVKANYHVLEHGGEIYDAILNRANVSDNSNDFYVIQALESDSGGAFMVFARWGRVGVEGQNQLQQFASRDAAIKVFGLYFYAKTQHVWSRRKNFVCQPSVDFTSRRAAIREHFERKFYRKTRNVLSSRKNFVCQPQLYTWLEMDYKLKDSSIQPQPRETQLESRVANFISLICDVRMMKQQMVEIGYNAKKLPLGKLSKSTILKGYNVLKSISEAMNAKPDRKTLEELTGAFYTIIPHDFGSKNIREFIIDTPQKLKSNIEMVEALREIELATKLLEDDDDVHEDILYTHYNRLQCELKAINVGSKEYSMIEKYIKNSSSNYTVDIVQLFTVSKKCEDERFRKFSNTENRMLLWHGSRLTNWTGILSQGLRVPGALSTGRVLGRGVYFADMFSKSANYCHPSLSSGTGVLLLCEVALGEMEEPLHGHPGSYSAFNLPPGKISIKAVGSTAPDPTEFQTLDDGVIVPLGKPKKQRGQMGVAHNEYVVYNADQIRMRYLIHVNFNYGNRRW